MTRKEVVEIAYQKGYRVNESGEVFFTKTGRQRKLQDHGGYLKFTIKCPDMAREIFVHKLQAYQKYGDGAFVNQVRHLDNNSHNNHWNNIGIGTQTDNHFDMSPERRLSKAVHAATKLRKFTDEQVKQIRAFHQHSKSYRETKRKFDISSSTLHYILNTDYQTSK